MIERMILTGFPDTNEFYAARFAGKIETNTHCTGSLYTLLTVLVEVGWRVLDVGQYGACFQYVLQKDTPAGLLSCQVWAAQANPA